jgi:hypothetical protein
LRSYFEPRFERDFSEVRVHAASDTARGAQGIDARAFTVGRDIGFAAGEYAPATPRGRQLIAHELAHVVQQTAIGTNNSIVQRQAASPPVQSQQANRRNLTNTEHGFVNPIENARIEMSIKAVGKLVGMIQDIVTGDPDLLRSKEPDDPARKSRSRSVGKAAPTPDDQKRKVRLAVRRHLNLGYLFHWDNSSYDWLNDPRAAKALDVITKATDMIILQASRRLPRKVRNQSDNRSLAEKPLAEDIILFDPTFFDNKHWSTELCWTFVVMHEYMHFAGAFHGEDISQNMQKFTDYTPEFALANADSLTELVFELALGRPFDVNCHKPGA